MSKSNKLTLTGTFRERLYQARTQMGWSQSDLARQVWGTERDTRGYEVAAKRDRISSYEKGKSMPEFENLLKICEVFGLDPNELAPDILAYRAERGLQAPPAIQMTMVDGDPGRVHLRIDTIMSMADATKIMGILSDAASN